MTCIIAKNDKYWYIPYVQYTVYTVYIVLLLKTRHILKLFPEILQLSSSVNSPKMRISFPLIFFIYCRAFDAYSSIELRRRCMQYCGSGSPNPHHFPPQKPYHFPGSGSISKLQLDTNYSIQKSQGSGSNPKNSKNDVNKIVFIYF